jgi:hypothetical protein
MDITTALSFCRKCTGFAIGAQLCTKSDSSCCNSPLLAAVVSATLRFLLQLALQLCTSCSIWCCNSALHVAVAIATLRFMQQLALQL